MNLTKQDLEAIGSLFDEKLQKHEERIEAKFDAKLAPIWDTLKELLKTQVDIVKRIQFMEFQIEGLKTDFYNLRHELTGFKHDLATLKTDVEHLKKSR